MFVFASIMTFIFTIAKILGYLDWAWLLIFSPIIAWFVVTMLILVLGFLGFIGIDLYLNKGDK